MTKPVSFQNDGITVNPSISFSVLCLFFNNSKKLNMEKLIVFMIHKSHEKTTAGQKKCLL